MVDIKKIFDVSKSTIGIYFLFNIIAYGIYALFTLFGLIQGTSSQTAGSDLTITENIAILLWLITLSVSFSILVYGGYKGAKQGLDLVSCGLIGMMSWIISTPILWIIEYNGKLFFNTGFLANSGFGIQALTALNSTGIFLDLVFLFGAYLIGFLITFLTSVIGGLLGSAR